VVNEVAQNIFQQAKQNNVHYHMIRKADYFGNKHGVSSVTYAKENKKLVKLIIN